MRKTSLLAHLAIKLIPQKENIATEALNHILYTSSTARESFLQYIEQSSIKLNGDLKFKTQDADEDGSIPDLVGTDANRDKVFIIESKFWAGLTENQPVAYISQLPENKNGVLLFIAPVKRILTLWPELLRRCKDAKINTGATTSVGHEFFTVPLNKNHCMAVASWRSVLAFILRSVEAERETDVASDISQLQGLVEQMDEGAFLPLNSEDLTSNIGLRIMQYCELVDDVTKLLTKDKLVSTEGLTTTRGAGIYGRYMRISSFSGCLLFDASRWGSLRSTPLWLIIVDDDTWESSQTAKKYLAKLELEEPPRLIQINERVLIPLHLRTGVERDDVINDLKKQIIDIVELLQASTS